ncbi:TRAP transporter small permease [Jiella avicenniae]|uniref:TRAP transporter small permease n=1 Tax=Jiella avicenniae TaxID=2907202 RepID=UPI001F1EA489
MERGLAAICLAVAIMALMLQVVARYGFDSALPWPEELAKFAFVWATFLGAAAGAGQKAHIVVDLVVGALPVRVRLMLAALVNATLVALLLVLAWHGARLVTLGFNSRLPAIELPLGTLFMAGPVALFLMAISYTAEFLSSASALARGAEEIEGDDAVVDPAKIIG